MDLLLIFCFALSVLAAASVFIIKKLFDAEKIKAFNLFKVALTCVFIALAIMFFPVRFITADEGVSAVFNAFLSAMQAFALGIEFDTVVVALDKIGGNFSVICRWWLSILCFVAPLFTFGFILSLFKNVYAYMNYYLIRNKTVYAFSELNEKALTLAEDIKSKEGNVGIVFADAFKNNDDKSLALLDRAKSINAVCFKKEIIAIKFGKISKMNELYFLITSSNETENLNQTLSLVEAYKERKNTNIYLFSTKTDSDLIMPAIDKGEVKVRRVNEVNSLINYILYNKGNIIFDSALEAEDGTKEISAVIVGMGCHGTEMVKALSWYCQMDGYRAEITAFDKDELAYDRFCALAPELMDSRYNDVAVEGEAYYKISVKPNIDAETKAFADEIAKLKKATYVFISLGDDNLNIKTAANLRMLFERNGCKPVIQAVCKSSKQKQLFADIRNYKGQKYNIELVGDMQSMYAEDVIIDSRLEAAALKCHLKWGKEEEFWAYEYNYQSSCASAIHIKARIACGIPGASKSEDELSIEERDIIERLEHRRWNAYMRSEGYIYSGSDDEESRNDLAKMHHNLVCFDRLSDADKRKDSSVGTN